MGRRFRRANPEGRARLPDPATPRWLLVTGLRTAMQEGGWYSINIEAQKEAQATKGELE